VAGASGRIGMSDDAVLDTDGVLGADFTSLFVLFYSSDWTTGAAAAADAVTGASVNDKVSPESAVLSTEGAGGAGFTFLDLILAFSSGFFLVISEGSIRLLVGVAGEPFWRSPCKISSCAPTSFFFSVHSSMSCMSFCSAFVSPVLRLICFDLFCFVFVSF
jgi:hypothetical protein